MNKQDNIQDELNELNSKLPSGQNETPYAIPDGYFDNLASSVLAKVKAEQVISASKEIAQLSPLLAGLSRKMPFTVPANYFQETVEMLPALSLQNEESAFLVSIGKAMPYTVPAGYFTSLPQQVLDKVIRSKARVVPLMKRKWMRMAIAAVVTGIMAISGFYYFGNKQNISVNNPQWVAKNLKNVSDKAIDDFIKATDVTSSNTTAKTSNTNDAKKMLKDISDKELNAFLDQVPTEDAAMTN